MRTVPLPPSQHHKNKDTIAAWARDAEAALVGLARPSGYRYEVLLDFYAPFGREDGTDDPKMPDIDRLATRLLDIIARVVGYNDRQNWRVVLTKRQSSNPRCEVWLRPLGVYSPGL